MATQEAKSKVAAAERGCERVEQQLREPKALDIYGQLEFVTVDNASTRDIDDGMWMEKQGDDVHIVIAIADPTRLVAIDSTEDASARLLGSTIYVRDQAVRKMLPPRISEEEGSLVAGRRRKAFVMDIVLGQDMEVRAFELHRCMVKVAHRLSYEDIPDILQQQAHALRPMVGLAAQIGRLLLQKRRQAGALALYDLTRLLLTDEDGRLVQLSRADEMVGHIIVQELMVLTNTLMAGYMLSHSIPGIFRNHEPSSAAPPADELARTIEVWMQSKVFDAENVQAQFALVVGKAHYSAYAKGHFALAIGCYGHFTSPLRRYADLINLRQVRAHLKSQALPYDTEQLNSLAQDLNEAMERRKLERTQGFKDVVTRTATLALERNRLTHLADHELAKAVKLAHAAGELPEGLSTELVRRLDYAIATDKLTDALVMEVPGKLWPDSLKAAFLNWMLLNPARSMHIVNHGAQTGAFKDMTITPAGEGTSFTAQVRFHTTEGLQVQASGAGARKKDAEQNAANGAVAQFLGLSVVDGAVNSRALEAAAPVAGNPKGALLELCQKCGWDMPTFEGMGKGPSHAMLFSATVKLIVSGQLYSASANGTSNKKDAEARACEALLLKLADAGVGAAKVPVGAPCTIDNTGQHPNPIGALQEMAQKGKFSPPDYLITTLQVDPPKFQSIATVTINGQRRTFTATSNAKQDAKKISAAMALSECVRKSEH